MNGTRRSASRADSGRSGPGDEDQGDERHRRRVHGVLSLPVRISRSRGGFETIVRRARCSPRTRSLLSRPRTPIRSNAQLMSRRRRWPTASGNVERIVLAACSQSTKELEPEKLGQVLARSRSSSDPGVLCGFVLLHEGSPAIGCGCRRSTRAPSTTPTMRPGAWVPVLATFWRTPLVRSAHLQAFTPMWMMAVMVDPSPADDICLPRDPHRKTHAHPKSDDSDFEILLPPSPNERDWGAAG